MTDWGNKQQISELKILVKAVPIEQIIGKYVKLRREGDELVACCPFHNEKSPSFKVNTRERFFHCFGCGANGDGIEFVMKKDGKNFLDALDAISGAFGLSSSGGKILNAPQKPIEKQSFKSVDKAEALKTARSIFKKSVPAKGTIVETYLSSRGIDISKLPDGVLQQLRYSVLDYYVPLENGRVKSLGLFPVMVAPMQYHDGKIRAVHLTFLKDDGSGKRVILHPETGERCPSKKMRGAPKGCAIRLGHVTNTMAVAEGIETGLSFVMARPEISVWVAGSVGNISGRGVGQGDPHPDHQGRFLPSTIPDHDHPGLEFPVTVKTIFIIVDNDSKDQKAIDALMVRAGRRYLKRGFHVKMVRPPAGHDLNDIAMACASQKLKEVNHAVHA